MSHSKSSSPDGETPNLQGFKPEVKDERGQVRHVRGVTDSPGLYLLGMTWQHTRTSALLGWVGEDAAFLADQIEATKQAPAGSETLAEATS